MSKAREALLTDYVTKGQARFYRLAYSYLKNRDEALDAVQTAVCRAWEQQDALRDPEAIRPWFYRILVNVCTDLLRKRGRVTFVPPEALDMGSYEDPPLADDGLAARIDALLEKRLRGKDTDRETLRKAGAALARRGFRWEDIRDGLRRWGGDPEED